LRATLYSAPLDGYARRFVWLALDFDKPQNKAFLSNHAVAVTPTLFVLNSKDGHAMATQLGGLTARELTAFLERGERGARAAARTPADAALARGDDQMGRNQYAEAAASYGEALSLASKDGPDHDQVVGSYTWALMSNGQKQTCAETAAAEAPRMDRSESFGRVVLAGLSCLNGDDSPRAAAARPAIEALAVEAIGMPTILRDHRFQLYQQLMVAAQSRHDDASLKHWGDLWLRELDATSPVNDDERSALDIARVDAADLLGDPSRVLGALQASERAMPTNYNASLRLAQMQIVAKQYAAAISACNRGLRHVTGPLGRTWLLETKAEALVNEGEPAAARRELQSALRSARQISAKTNRENNIARALRLIAEVETQVK
jgi:tetratricopeptide (TPR) repeat protein